MKPVLWFRLGAIILLLFAIGHTVGFLTFRPDATDGLAVWQAMNSVHFSFGGGTYTFAGFYLGFGVFVTAFLVFCAWMALVLAGMAHRGIAEAATLAWGLVALQLVSAVVAWRYFFAPPLILSLLAAISFAMAAISTRRRIEQIS